jgi:hypothetical protein
MAHARVKKTQAAVFCEMTKHQAYEYLKALWLACNPTCSSAEYEAAMAAIARKVGL